MVDTFGRELNGAYIVTTPKGGFIGRLIGWTSLSRAIFESETGGRTIEASPGECKEFCGTFVQTFYTGKWRFKPWQLEK